MFEVLIVGTGAMACLFAARLAPHARVTLLGTWQEGIQAIQKHGIRLVERDGTERVFAVNATRDPRACSGTLHALVLVKSWQTSRAADQLAICLAEEGVALSLQNGIGNLEKLQERLGRERAALAVITCGATLIESGRVRVGGTGLTYIVPHERLEPLLGILREAGFAIEVASDLESLVWGKLVINAGINPLTALLQVPNGELLRRPEALHLMRGAAREAASVAEALGIRLPYSDVEAQVEDVARLTAENHSSMFQDIRRGAPTEIDAICGAIVREGSRLGVSTPINETLWRLIRALRSGNEGHQE
jgi:2-dehydropantoate 2-reductase